MTTQQSELKHGDVTFTIVRAFYDVYNELGFGFLESVYREAMSLQLRAQGHTVEQERPVEVKFRGTIVGLYRTDLVVDDKVIVELKCARSLENANEAQLLNYLKATGFEVGLLLNFGHRPQFKRMIFDVLKKESVKIRENPRLN
jgi:GxxExxY protein